MDAPALGAYFQALEVVIESTLKRSQPGHEIKKALEPHAKKILDLSVRFSGISDEKDSASRSKSTVPANDISPLHSTTYLLQLLLPEPRLIQTTFPLLLKLPLTPFLVLKLPLDLSQMMALALTLFPRLVRSVRPWDFCQIGMPTHYSKDLP
jgi:hypothetical protein